MASGDALRRLLRAYAAEDDEAFRVAAASIIEDERSKNHRLLADDLDRILRRRPRRELLPQAKVEGRLASPPRDRDRGLALIRASKPNSSWSRLILPERDVQRLRRLVDEHRRRDLLDVAGLRPTQRVLFHGPPGSGKTLAAEVVASALDYPLAVVRFDAIVSSLLGETAANLVKVFEYVDSMKAVVLFDEFDAIGKERSDPSEHGELRRVVNALLQLMDAYEGSSLLIAATNHEALLDTAIWRRFELVVPFSLPATQDRELMLRSFLRGYQYDERALHNIAAKTQGASGADLEMIAVNAARSSILNLRTSVSVGDLEQGLRDYEDRHRPSIGT